MRDAQPDQTREQHKPANGQTQKIVVITYAIIEAMVLAWVVIKHLDR